MFTGRKFKVKKTKQAESEYDTLTAEQQSLVDDDYEKVEKEGIHRVSTKKLEKDLYEIRTDTVRSLYTYRESELIIVSLRKNYHFSRKLHRTVVCYPAHDLHFTHLRSCLKKFEKLSFFDFFRTLLW